MGEMRRVEVYILPLFVSLAECGSDLIRARTHAGLQAARARGCLGGRPKGLSAAAQKKAIAAEALYTEGKLSVRDIAHNQGISKATLYSYLRHRRVNIGAYKKSPMKQKVMKVERNLGFP